MVPRPQLFVKVGVARALPPRERAPVPYGVGATPRVLITVAEVGDQIVTDSL